MKRRYSRREFLKQAGIGAAGLAAGPAILNTAFAQTSGRRSLRILQWSHFVPTHDKWYDQYAKEWGEKNNVDVIVDHIGLADLRSTFASEVAAGKGHDIVEFIDPPSDFEPSVMDLTDLNQEAVKRFGKQLPVATRSSYNPHTKKYYGFCHGWTIDPGDYRKSLWEKAGKPDGPVTWMTCWSTVPRSRTSRASSSGSACPRSSTPTWPSGRSCGPSTRPFRTRTRSSSWTTRRPLRP
jgi:multiple sugar transport system substrate-binding protein